MQVQIYLTLGIKTCSIFGVHDIAFNKHARMSIKMVVVVVDVIAIE